MTNKIKIRPILFRPEMIRALLAGWKTQTRREVKPNPVHAYAAHINWRNVAYGEDNSIAQFTAEKVTNYMNSLVCPFGKPGDLLWVRETFFMPPAINVKMLRDGADTWPDYIYCADIDDYDADFCLENKWKKKPSIFLPRAASRLTLEITDVRIQRIQEMIRGDAMEEGCPFKNMQHGHDPLDWYADLWQSINGAGSWDKNPWVWAITFKVHQ